MTWPEVISEEETLLMVQSGRSLARYGDGEFKLALGSGIRSQRYDEKLSRRLREILRSSGACLVGIPNLRAPTKPFWDQFRNSRPWLGLLSPKVRYASAFVSRPDSAPWIHSPKYWKAVRSLWAGRDVTLVRGSGKSLTASDLYPLAHSVNEIVCARQHAWSERSTLLEKIGKPERVLLCCGPTATVLAAELAEKGVHAIDLGHIGMFMRRAQMSADEALAAGRAEV